MKVTGILLAGGKSSRMGQNKALLSFSDRKTVEKIASELQEATDEVLLVTNTFSDYKFLRLKMVEDEYKEKGPLAGIHAGLQAAENEYCFVAACDMPFIQGELIREIVSYLNEYDAVVPNIRGQLHPLFAAYRRSCLESIEACIKNNDLRIRSFHSKVSTKIMKEEDFSTDVRNSSAFLYNFFNMNLPQEYEEAIEIHKIFQNLD
ncbi:molybdenum cofactor guanylyltransferase [Peribacillus tepidiphilus]|uniref:molybdenum cofactor guanylyltransferase n=1 Tax=Peribacillus tepidiphilus TaxID=2652445 RepID=UPI0035B53E97